MRLLVHLVRLARHLSMLLVSGLPFFVVLIMLLFVVLASLVLLIIVALSPVALRRVMRAIDVCHSPCHCNGKFYRVRRPYPRRKTGRN